MRIESGATPFAPNIRFFHSRKKCERWLRRHGYEYELCDTAHAQTMFEDGEAIVLFDGTSGDDILDLALLVHEAYHVVTRNLEFIGEAEVGEETAAYMMQWVSVMLFAAHMAWKERHNGSEGGDKEQLRGDAVTTDGGDRQGT